MKALPAALVLALFLVASIFGAEPSLLCFGPDGHVAVEFVDACNGSGIGSDLAGAEGDACGPCKDIKFLSDPAMTISSWHAGLTFPISFASFMTSSLPSHEYPGKYNNLPQDQPQKTLAALHSVVLLI